MTKQSKSPAFAHPVGAFPLSVKTRRADALFQALLRANMSYIMLAADHLDEDGRDIALGFVEVADQLTNGIVKLSQRDREEKKFALRELHADLLKRGCAVLGGRVAIAILRQPRDDAGVIMGEWTDRVEMTAIVITDATTAEATMFMPLGEVASRDEGIIEPTSEMPWTSPPTQETDLG
jgi:hypothetical protein